jgi:hypothetical protein
VTLPRATWGRLAPRHEAGPRARGGPRCVIDAGGRSAPVARASGRITVRTDRLVAIVGTLDGTSPAVAPDDRVLVSATRDGWWSTMLLPDGRRIAALHRDADQQAPPAASPSAWWAALLAVPLVGDAAAREGRAAPVALSTVAAGSQWLQEPSGDLSAVVAAGDAEMAFDPLSSFGILGAISSAEEALPVVAERMGGIERGAAWQTRELAREGRWSRYQARLAAAYAEERRWPDAPFWRRRHAPTPRPTGAGPSPGA